MWRCRRPKTLEAGDRAPEFNLKILGGGSTSLADKLLTGPTLLAFFKVGCPVCQMTFPFLQRMADTTAVQLVGVSQDEAAHTEKFNQRFGVTFPTFLDEAAQGYAASNAFGISSVPTFFLVETNGSISKAFQGFSKRDLEELGARMGVPPFNPGEKVPDFRPG
jgi:peroxiredoxin